ncbi:MAG TPA: molybdopterin-dependent oxidoreductase [Bryobacteraceae bacterium]|nr:molybdopterin-dependent oxidoreductase [Bryobacteraceae bacterium]
MRWISSIAAVAFTAGLAFSQDLVVKGDVASPVTLKAEELASMPREKVGEFEGVLLREVLKKAGAPLDGQLRKNALTTYLLAQAKDGYQVVFSLGELDASMGNEKVLVADKQHGNAIPLRVVCADDKVGARSVKMLETLEVVRLKK